MKISSIKYLIILLVLLTIVRCKTTSFKGYRMLQVEKGYKIYGPKRFSLNSPITYYNSNQQQVYQGTTVVIKEKEFTNPLLQMFLDSRADSLIILTVGDSFDSKESQFDFSSYYNLEESFNYQEIPIPIYFIRESIFQENSFNTASSGDSRLVISSGTTSPISQVTGVNYYGILKGTSLNSDRLINPQIVVIANYDSFSYVPGQSTGKYSPNSSGAIALLELVRIFSKLYSNPMTIGQYNIIFLLGDASKLNYYGTRKFIESQSGLSLDSIEFVLCLDSLDKISTSSDLFMQVSKPPKETSTKELYEEFQNTYSQVFNGQLEIVHKKINISNPTIFWEHEQFSRKRIQSMTLTNRKSYDTKVNKGEEIDIDNLSNNIKFIATSLISHIYKGQELQSSKNSLSDLININKEFLRSYKELLDNSITMLPYSSISDLSIKSMSSGKDQQKTILHQSFESVFRSYLQDSQVDRYSISSNDLSDTKYYLPVEAEMEFFIVKSFFFEILHFLSVISYLLLIYILIKGKSGIIDVKNYVESFINPQDSKKKY